MSSSANKISSVLLQKPFQYRNDKKKLQILARRIIKNDSFLVNNLFFCSFIYRTKRYERNEHRLYFEQFRFYLSKNTKEKKEKIRANKTKIRRK